MRLLVISEVAELLRVPRARAYALARSGLIPSVRVGRQVRVPAEALRDWVAAGGQTLRSSEEGAR
jgi:excisionase family DNA binding protein